MYYADTASCLDQQTYVIVGDPHFGILQPQCRVELVTLTSSWRDTLHAYDIKGVFGKRKVSSKELRELVPYVFYRHLFQSSPLVF
ncbi:hypothetical protein MTR_1g028060 [Medicago truncatula]|uniref:Uncharacterized protein n=1 Tax=Medicago truncatula TaxID=3880 RepID=A0A072VF43_MEDTR|nr:hypothetical protein MTR_1g028060 [Medicago truncatula]